MNNTVVNRRTALSYAAVAGSLAAITSATNVFGEDAHKHPVDQKAALPIDSQMLQDCLSKCEECYRDCTRTVQYCLEKGGHHATAPHIKLLLDCAEICQTNANFLTRSSAMHQATCEACAKICDACAKECEAMSANDPQMKKCADSTLACAKSCKKMAAA